MKKLLLLFTVLFLSFSVFAENVDQTKAQLIAKAFAAQRERGAAQLKIDIVYSHPMPNKRDAAFYVVNLGETGFVIVSANDVAHPVIGYSFDRPWPTEGTIPPQITDYLDDLAGQIEAASQNQPDKATKAEWQELLSINPNNPPQPKGNRTEVGPLLTTTWDQGQYYNNMTPETGSGHAVTGCVATAMAQIINYHEYPTNGRGTHSYQSNYGELSVNFANSMYDYTNMPDALNNESSEAQVNAVAKLMSDCGIAVNMGYTSGESGAYDHDARGAFINFFKYSPDMGYAEKKFYSENEWYTMLRNDLNASNPIYYSGRSDSGGHAFVCDGYNSEDYFSFNFGWSGNCNGWYLLDAVLGYNNNQAAILGIIPEENGNVIIGQTSGDSYFDMYEPMEFYSSNGHNPYFSTEYTNDCQNQVVFTSDDLSKALIVDVVYYENQSVWFNTAIDEHCFLSPSATDFSPFYMVGNVASLNYSGYINSKGFALYVRHDEDCQMPNIDIAIDTTSVCVWNSYYEPSVLWQLEYGLAGFTQGEGVLLNVETAQATINNLTKYATYDIYARTTCGANQNSPWVKRTVELDPYWTDVVREQPDGFVEDANGNVEISSAEGLAWLSVLINGFQGNQPNKFEGKTITLTSDINLKGYRWYPMGRYLNWEWTEFSGTFEGQGHAISNIYVRDASSNLGLFGRVTKGRIRNVNMFGGSVSSTREPVGNDPQYWLPSSTIGGLAGETRDCYEITNCHSSVDVSGNGGAGSLCGYIWAYESNIPTIITNCSASGTVMGREVCGGLVGGVYGDVVIRNCYATGDVLITVCDVDAWDVGRGGLIGLIYQQAKVYNSYSTGQVESDSDYHGPIGRLVGYYDKSYASFVYGEYDSNPNMTLFGMVDESISDTALFYHNGDTNALLTSVSVDGTSYSDLIDVLNAWVEWQNDQNLKTWVSDGQSGYPVFGDYYEPSCYNPSDVVVTNATIVGNSTIRTQLEWTQIGEPDHWEVLYVPAQHDMNEGVVVSVDSNPCILEDIPVGHPLDFYVRSICGEADASGWSNPVTYIPDKLRWTEVVTSQPEGYVEDAEGNIYISSAEGLAWLSSVSNGLNGANYNEYGFVDKRIVITKDIDLSGYRWTSIASSRATVLRGCDIDGNNHIINGLYCNELEDHQGLFGCITGGTISNLILKQCDVYGENYSGVLAGQAYCVDITNCATTGNVYGIESVGGIIGKSNGSSIRNSYYIGTASSRTDITKTNSQPYFNGGICGVPNGSTIINCYVVSEISDEFDWSGIITSTANCPEIVSNCYYKAYETTLPITSDNCTVENNSSFSGSGTTWTLNTPPYVNGAFRTDLLDALNAWVDANNTNGEYLHWVADTENQNGGFPMLEPVPATEYQIQPLVSGWNWYSTYIEQDGTTGMLQLKNTLGGNGVQIKSQTSTTQHLPNGSWLGTLTTLENEKSYRVNVSASTTAVLQGTPVNPEEHPITLQPNWTWIGYPVSTTQSIAAATTGFTPRSGDMIKSQGSSSIYTGASWFPSLNLEPGQGYLYKSTATDNRTLTFVQSREEGQQEETYKRYWANNVHAFADNMTIITVITENGEELYSNNYELGAFVNGENRGSVRVEYCEQLDRYVAVLTISGEDGERVTFGLVNRATETENFDCSRAITFSTNAVLGSLENIETIEFKSEYKTATMTLFPNPVDKDAEFTIDIPTNEKIMEVIITNSVGSIIRDERVLQGNIIKGLHRSGVYNIQIITERGNNYRGRVVVK